MSIEVNLKNGKWVCMRPKRYATQLEFSLQRYGLMMSGPVLFGMEPLDVLRDKDGRVWVKGLLTEIDVLAKAFSDPDWYVAASKKRTNAYSDLRQHLNLIQTDILPNIVSWEVMTDALADVGEMLTIFYTYIQLGLIDTEVVDNFSSLIYQLVPAKRASQYISELLHSSYAHHFNSLGILMNESKSISVNQKHWFPVIQGEINFELPLLVTDFMNDHVPAEQVTRFFSLAKLTSVAYQLGQENLFLGKPLFDTFSFLLSKLGEIFQERKLLSTKDALLDLNYEEILFQLVRIGNNSLKL